MPPAWRSPALRSPFPRAPIFRTTPIRLITPFASGAGAVDAAARLVAEKMAAHLNNPVVVVPQPGAGSHLGANAAAKAPKDGYTMFFGTAANMGFGKLLNKDLQYDPVKDLQPLIMVGSVPVGIFVSANSE